MAMRSRSEIPAGGPLTRRAFVALGVAAGAVAQIPARQGQAATTGSFSWSPLPSIGKIPFKEPPVIPSRDGLLETTLTVKMREERVDGKSLRYRTYNGEFTGPTLRFGPGDVVRVKLDNALPAEGPHGAADVNRAHGLNVTNLHTHGLWVSPAGNSDNVLLRLGPGTSFQHEYLIPQEHVAGTFWYHPHKHGSVEMQVNNGMSGAIIVEGGIDELLKDTVAKERLCVLQQLQPEEEGDALAAVRPRTVAEIAGSPDKVTTINGQRGPTLEMAPREIERWRFIAANAHDILHIELRPAGGGNSLPLYPIAYDGIPVKKVTRTTRIRMAPGNRVDVLVSPQVAGDYVIYKIRDKGQFDVIPEDEIIGYLQVRGRPPARPAQIPKSFPPEYSHPDISEADVTNRRKVLFSVPSVPGGVRFEIDNHVFDENRVDQLVTLNAVEEWRLENDSTTIHPFHIHVNPFQIVESSDPLLEAGVWLDTVPVPPVQESGAPGFVVMRTRIQRFVGRFVLHCHILAHEDLGMMQLVEIVDPAAR